MKEEGWECVISWVPISGSTPNRKLRCYDSPLLDISYMVRIPECLPFDFRFGVEPETRTPLITAPTEFAIYKIRPFSISPDFSRIFRGRGDRH